MPGRTAGSDGQAAPMAEASIGSAGLPGFAGRLRQLPSCTKPGASVFA